MKSEVDVKKQLFTDAETNTVSSSGLMLMTYVRNDMTCKSFVFEFLSSILRENILNFTIIFLTVFFLSTVLLNKNGQQWHREFRNVFFLSY